MLELFPSLPEVNLLAVEDFSRFSSSYAEIVREYIPAAEQVIFILSAAEAERYFKENEFIAELLPLLEQINNGEVAPCGIYGNYLMLSFAVKGDVGSVAIISADPLFLRRVDEDWLLKTRAKVEREFLLFKQARVDSQTGLLNVSNLNSLLDTYGTGDGFHLILLELAPKRTSFQNFLRYSQKCAALLQNFVQTDSILHSLGHSVFALVLQHEHDGARLEIESALVSYLKREGCHRVHIGSSSSPKSSGSEKQMPSGRQLLDEAWTALRQAAKRGPFSFCEFASLAHPENHPLAPPGRNLVRRFNRLWSNSDSFCLVQFSGDNINCTAKDLVPPYIDRGIILPSDKDIYVYLDGLKTGEALEWANKVIGRITNPEKNTHVSAGVSGYPYCDFKKSEVVANCRKALHHAAFYGESSAAVFDAVTLNISGDIYFGEGDLAKAVREYKRGLKCDSRDINLHNSLGVALAMMNNLSAALQSFQNGLSIDNSNFMALYNLGLGEQSRNRKAEALEYLEKAWQYYSQDEDGEELVSDLALQLGILSCELGKYDAALSYLLRWQQENNNPQRVGRIHYYLGEAYHGLKNNRKAMEALQRALRFDELDDRAMNLLGRVYLEEGEGNEIALSLCRKSVELEPSNYRYKLYLAEVLLRCGFFAEARKNLYRCLKSRECKIKAQLLLGGSYSQEGRHRRAKSWFDKVPGEKNG